MPLMGSIVRCTIKGIVMLRKPLSLALQGGGAHGAFTWGVLDLLLETPGFRPDAISGCSAGAMNAVVLASGWAQGGAEGAREALGRFWRALSQDSPLAWMALPGGPQLGDQLSFSWHELLVKSLSRTAVADLNPLDINPLRDLLRDQIDFDAVRRSPVKLFISATNVRSGQLRLMRNHELELDALLASACLPQVHRTVQWQGEAYWDGGFSANPAIHPLVYESPAHDILLVLLQPALRDAIPHSTHEVADRVAELGFSSNLLREMRAIAMARRYAGRSRWWSGRLERRLGQLRFHLLEPAEQLAQLPRSSKYDTRGSFLERLHLLGREHAAQWLAQSAQHVGRRSSLDLEQRFM